MNFTKIILTNVSTQAVVKVLPFNQDNERVADKMAREWNMEKGARIGLAWQQTPLAFENQG